MRGLATAMGGRRLGQEVSGAGDDGVSWWLRRAAVLRLVCGQVGGSGGQHSYAAATCSRRTDNPLEGLLRHV